MDGLAAQMVYGDGEGQTITHYYEKPKLIKKSKSRSSKKPKKSCKR